MFSRAIKRRPSAALVVALLALFVAVGGPAEAARLIGSKDVKNHSLKTQDLSRKAVRTLRATPPNSVGARQLIDGAVTPVKIAPSAVGSFQLAENAVGTRELRVGAAGTAQIADGAVTGAKIADGTLDSRDTTRYSGRFRVTVPAVMNHRCWSGEPVGLAPEQAGADISGDLVLVTPDASWPERSLAFTVRGSATRSRFVLAGCNVTDATTDEVEVGFRYIVIDLP
ncbi:MAG TPA: hypothetical protein VFN44_23850 [Solirubrobacteraceae bacterium]|nr:hypothetical protein [Solirubrobacteraceae bacterium]